MSNLHTCVLEDPAVLTIHYPTVVVGISGKAGAGKDCVATYLRVLADMAGVPCTQMAFADRLKADARRCGWDGKKDSPGRFLLQILGQSRRDMDPEYWIKALAGDQDDGPGLTIITDVRHVNEAQWIANTGGETWRVVKEGGGGLPDGLSQHISETALDDWDFSTKITAPAGDLQVLFDRVREAFDDLCSRRSVPR